MDLTRNINEQYVKTFSEITKIPTHSEINAKIVHPFKIPTKTVNKTSDNKSELTAMLQKSASKWNK